MLSKKAITRRLDAFSKTPSGHRLKMLAIGAPLQFSREGAAQAPGHSQIELSGCGVTAVLQKAKPTDPCRD